MSAFQNNHVFPSYKTIKQTITHNKAQLYQQKIANLTQKLQSIQKAVDFQADHTAIKQSIIGLSQQVADRNILEKETLKWEKHHRYQYSSYNTESLNYFIEDDKQEENNYETFLKFKKKALERDLQEDLPDHMTTEDRRRQRNQEQNLFKKLYQRSHQYEISHLSKSSMLKPPNPICKHKTNKADAGRCFKRFSHLKSVHKSKQFSADKEEEMQNHYDKESQAYQKNKKFLIQNYKEILKKLQSTNIVKWRILTSQNQYND